MKVIKKYCNCKFECSRKGPNYFCPYLPGHDGPECKLLRHQNGTKFQKDVWDSISRIPIGQIKTYVEIAEEIRRPNAHRAVANACAANKLAPFVPCHRVVGSNGYIGGYSAFEGIKTKLELLKQEGVILKIINHKSGKYERIM